MFMEQDRDYFIVIENTTSVSVSPAYFGVFNSYRCARDWAKEHLKDRDWRIVLMDAVADPE